MFRNVPHRIARYWFPLAICLWNSAPAAEPKRPTTKATSTSKGTQVVTEMVADSVSLELCDCVAAVEVRVMSLGPGGCAVKFRTSQGEKGLLALPATWSGWLSVYESTAAQKISLEREVVCDTGVRAQVRYWK